MRRIGAPVVLTVLMLGLLLPVVPLLLWAWNSSWRYPDLLPAAPTGRGLSLVLSGQVITALLTSLLVGVCVSTLACAIGFPAGRLLGLTRFPGRGAVRFLLLAPVVVPALAVTLGLQVFFIRLGLADNVAGVVLVQLVPTVPYAATLLTAAFEDYDLDLERVARSLGAKPWRVLLDVTLPTLAPAVLLTALLTFLISWSEYILTLLVGGGQVQTLPLLLFAAIGSSDRTAAAALGLLVVLPPVLLVVLARRVLRRTPVAIGLAQMWAQI